MGLTAFPPSRVVTDGTDKPALTHRKPGQINEKYSGHHIHNLLVVYFHTCTSMKGQSCPCPPALKAPCARRPDLLRPQGPRENTADSAFSTLFSTPGLKAATRALLELSTLVCRPSCLTTAGPSLAPLACQGAPPPWPTCWPLRLVCHPSKARVTQPQPAAVQCCSF